MKAESVNPFTLPSLPLAARKQLPDCPAIYFVLEGDAVLYVGKTRNLQQRWAVHHRWRQLRVLSGDIRVAWLECRETALLADIEAALIEHFQPALNGTAVVSKPPRVVVYLPLQLKAELQKLADSERRSLSQMAAILIERGIEEPEKRQITTTQGGPSDGQ